MVALSLILSKVTAATSMSLSNPTAALMQLLDGIQLFTSGETAPSPASPPNASPSAPPPSATGSSASSRPGTMTIDDEC